jgi:hypothetical protein
VRELLEKSAVERSALRLLKAVWPMLEESLARFLVGEPDG